MSALDDILKPMLELYSLAEIARVAEIHPTHLSNLIAGRSNATKTTLAKLRFAASRFRAGQTDISAMLAANFRLLMIICAVATELDPIMVQESEPGAKKAANKDWRAASFCRWMAQYLMNTGLGVSQAEVARASGVTKQAVSLAMGEVELRLDDPDFGALMQRLDDCILRARQGLLNAQ